MTDIPMGDTHHVNRLLDDAPPLHERSYEFVLQALHAVIDSLDEPRHISGLELSEGVRDLALARYGPMARAVLEHWGIRKTQDVGRVVFEMMEEGILVKEEEDRPEDFADLFDFAEAFEEGYPWGAQLEEPSGS